MNGYVDQIDSIVHFEGILQQPLFGCGDGELH